MEARSSHAAAASRHPQNEGGVAPMHRRANLSDWVWGRTVLCGGGAGDASSIVVRWKHAGALAARREARSWRVGLRAFGFRL